jgi:hypothetical protein
MSIFTPALTTKQFQRFHAMQGSDSDDSDDDGDEDMFEENDFD